MAASQMQRIDSAMALIKMELLKAVNRHDPFNSPHEGWAVIREEVDELWEEVRADRGAEDSALDEAIQIAAMAARYLVDLTN